MINISHKCLESYCNQPIITEFTETQLLELRECVLSDRDYHNDVLSRIDKNLSAFKDRIVNNKNCQVGE